MYNILNILCNQNGVINIHDSQIRWLTQPELVKGTLLLTSGSELLLQYKSSFGTAEHLHRQQHDKLALQHFRTLFS